MDLDNKLRLIEEVGEEIIGRNELQELLQNADSQELIAYDGFEPSGQIHIAQGLVKAINVNKMTSCGIKFKMFVADWHALANNKLDGDLEKIQTTGKYFIEVWRACGMDLSNVEFIWASDLVKDPNYWMLVLKIAKTNSINRFIRTSEIMGRAESSDLTGAQIMYSCMQTADIFTLGARITQLGMDQRKVNVLAREIGSQLGFWKPIIVSHHMLAGLKAPTDSVSAIDDKIGKTIALKMSKSDPDSAIFMTDSRSDIERKINKAYCPEGIVEGNPVLEYCKYILFEKYSSLTIPRAEKWGGPMEVNSIQELEKKFSKNEIHPQDLKAVVIEKLDELLQPIRNHFEKDKNASELLEKVKSFRVTK